MTLGVPAEQRAFINAMSRGSYNRKTRDSDMCFSSTSCTKSLMAYTMYVAKYAEKWLFAYLIQFFILGSGPSW